MRMSFNAIHELRIRNKTYFPPLYEYELFNKPFCFEAAFEAETAPSKWQVLHRFQLNQHDYGFVDRKLNRRCFSSIFSLTKEEKQRWPAACLLWKMYFSFGFLSHCAWLFFHSVIQSLGSFCYVLSLFYAKLILRIALNVS